MRTRFLTPALILLVGAAIGIMLARWFDQPAQVIAQEAKAGGAEASPQANPTETPPAG